MNIKLKRQLFLPLILIISNIALAETVIPKQWTPFLKQDPKLKQEILNLAINAYYKIKQTNKKIKPIITVIDYSLPSSTKRLWVLDLNQKTILYNSLVAHGQNSGDQLTKKVSNNKGSHQTSVGVFLTGKTYHGKNGYSLKLHGLEKGFNNNAYQRGIVIHASKYVNEYYVKKIGRIGRSWGCPAIESKLTKEIIDTICNGTMLFSFYPDDKWLNSSSYVSPKFYKNNFS